MLNEKKNILRSVITADSQTKWLFGPRCLCEQNTPYFMKKQ